MDEYIKKCDLYEKIANLEEIARNRYLDTPSNSPAYPRYMAQMNERTNLKHIIFDFPSADVAPVVHGRWIHYPDCGVTRCSHCGWSIEECWESKRCPECGAKMEGAE